MAVVVLASFLSVLLSGCFGSTTGALPPPPAPIEGNLTAIILSDGERLSVGAADVELTEAELVVRDPSGSVVRRVLRADVVEIQVTEFRLGRTILVAFPLYIITALMVGGESAPE